MSTDSIISHVLPFFLALVMTGVGMTLTPHDFLRLLAIPRCVLSILFAQLIVLPLLAFLVAINLSLPASLAIGLVLLAACPSGMMSNLFSHLARANVALSISLTALTGVVTIISIPLWLNLSINIFGVPQQGWELPIFRTMLTLFSLMLIPIVLGMCVRFYCPAIAPWADVWVSRVSLLFLSMLIFALIYKEPITFVEYVLEIGLAVVLLNGLAIASGWFVGKVAGLSYADTSTSVLEVGFQNSAMAIVVADSLLHTREIAIPASVYTLVMYLSGLVFVGLRRKKNRRLVEYTLVK